MNSDPYSSARPSHSDEQRSFPVESQTPRAGNICENEFDALLAAAARALHTMDPQLQRSESTDKSSQ